MPVILHVWIPFSTTKWSRCAPSNPSFPVEASLLQNTFSHSMTHCTHSRNFPFTSQACCSFWSILRACCQAMFSRSTVFSFPLISQGSFYRTWSAWEHFSWAARTHQLPCLGAVLWAASSSMKASMHLHLDPEAASWMVYVQKGLARLGLANLHNAVHTASEC